MDGVEPDPAAIRLAYSVTFTPNLCAWAVLSAAYNEKLARFASQRGLDWIDVAAWSRDAFRPRSAYFIDSVHPNSRGYELMGRFIATEMLKKGIVAGDGGLAPTSFVASRERERRL
jgi:hypothetical protein